MFNTLSLGHVHDTFFIREGEEKMRVRVDAEVTRIAEDVKNALVLVELAKRDPEKQEAAGMALARAMFGEKQTGDILAFYGGNALSVLEIAAKAFVQRIAKKIEKAQRKKG